ncbi:MAG: YetF domain-containing protein [Traorella sp.]
MNEYFELVIKCFFFYFIIISALRFMGKREIGELSIFDIVIYLVMSELLALSLSEKNESIFKTLVPLVTLSSLQIIVAYLIMKFEKFRTLIDGKPVILIHNGQINQNVMKKERYNIDDLMMQIRESNIGSIHEIAYAILETNGKLTLLKKTDCKVKYPFPLIQDGIIQKDALVASRVTLEDIFEAMKRNGINDIKEVFLCIYTKNGLSFIKKSNLIE